MDLNSIPLAFFPQIALIGAQITRMGLK